ncbi:MAG: TusE/DsrC/DsvC family sulfur relay protein [Desulfarculaceae bacterium]|nr:TusE/DsrC/DsvC family sulfur relay protein [Desulfarculaceae bacterium]MCF8049385.1 TusE/DsrC/DsvC family sulfur relay protein [Desulfarculaceae bacterium]MCF8066450.1 TusE/DsrC/DsvC family sulfur relay protein [Desulfarculaceae bacterium]MCF8099809.1 TusE/DsrC/DsvC family sulfur relay protein [Desulfarculaceae bacterium]MCF8121083.1 TusE/DsrC/DsvC family sulfur relay protein [Desulfarculaceae bacterium]
MPTVSFKGKDFEVDEDGFLQDPETWDVDFAHYVKEQEGISELSDEHWKVIHYLQDYYKKNGIAPMVRIMTKVTGYKLKQIYELFPSGPGKGACKMAGLAKPTGCV